MTQVVTELRAGDAYRMLGICQNLTTEASSTVAAALTAINIPLLRCSVAQQVDVDGIKQLYGLFPTLRLNMIVNAYVGGPTWSQQIPLIKQLTALGIVESIEGPNEENLFASHAVYDTAQYADLNAVKVGSLGWATVIGAAFPEVSRIYTSTVAIPSSASNFAAQAANVAGLVTHTAIHRYPALGGFQCNDNGAGYMPEAYGALPWHLAWARAATGVIPTVITETGMPGCAPYQSYTVSLLAQAKIVLADLLDCWALGIDRVFLYNLISSNDPNNNGGGEYHYGLLGYDNAPKPAGAAIARLQGMLYDPGVTVPNTVLLTSPSTGNVITIGASLRSSPRLFAPAPLPVTITGMDNTASAAGTYLSFRKSDGTDYIFTWNEPTIWSNNADVTPPTVSVTVGWGASRVYDVIDMISGSTVSSGTGTSAVAPLQGGAMAVRLHP